MGWKRSDAPRRSRLLQALEDVLNKA